MARETNCSLMASPQAMPHYYFLCHSIWLLRLSWRVIIFLFTEKQPEILLFQCCLFLSKSPYPYLVNSVYFDWGYISMIEQLINTNKTTMENLCTKLRPDSTSLIIALILPFELISFFYSLTHCRQPTFGIHWRNFWSEKKSKASGRML